MSTTIANNAQIISNTSNGYGHRKLIIHVNNDFNINYETSQMYLTDMLQDEDSDIVELAIERLINHALKSHEIQKSSDFTYIY